MKTLGQVAFEAYVAARDGKNHDGSETPGWDVLGEVQAGWEAAAQGVARALDEAEKTDSKGRRRDSER